MVGTYCFPLGLWGLSRNGDGTNPILTFHYICHIFMSVTIFFLLKIYEQSNVFGSPKVIVPLPSGEGTLGGPFEAVNSLNLRGDSAAPCFVAGKEKKKYL